MTELPPFTAGGAQPMVTEPEVGLTRNGVYGVPGAPCAGLADSGEEARKREAPTALSAEART